MLKIEESLWMPSAIGFPTYLIFIYRNAILANGYFGKAMDFKVI